ncbi:MAG: helix-turn-helix domain-containing protein [Alphaproteobacteria bacterium]
MNLSSQNMIILSLLKQYKGITIKDALEFDITRLAARIYDLKEKGHRIDKQMIELLSGKRVAYYSLIKEAQNDKPS